MPEVSKRSADYWARRMEMVQEAQLKKGEQYIKDLEKQYRQLEQSIEAQVSVWYQRYAVNNGVSMVEAKRILTTRELKEFRWSVEEYIKYGKQNAISQEWMKELENASARVHISRLEALKLQMQQQVEALSGNQLDDIDNLMRDIYQDGYYHTAFEIQKGFNVGYDLHAIDSKQLDKVISKPWTLDGKTFSDRIWTNKQTLINNLQTHLTQSVVTGKSPNKVIKEIAKQCNVDKSKAARLVMTESAAFSSAAQKDAYTELSVEQYEVVATLDLRTSEICQEMDGKVFDMSDYKVGITTPPFHVYCRSCTAPYFDDDYSERAARDADGKTYYVPSDMKYPEWKESFIDGGPKNDLQKLESGAKIKVGAIEEIQSHIEATAQFKDGGNVDLTGIPLDVSKKISESYDLVFNKYPQLKGQFSGLGINENGASTYASCVSASGSVNVNPKYFKSLEGLQKTYASDVARGFHPPGTDCTAIITHELGHALDGYMTNAGVAGGNWRYRTSYHMKMAVLKSLKLTEYDVGTQVSRYATKNDAEFFAECFAEYIHSDNPRPVAKRFGKLLGEWLKGMVK